MQRITCVFHSVIVVIYSVLDHQRVIGLSQTFLGEFLFSTVQETRRWPPLLELVFKKGWFRVLS